ncbi:hypothetical protein GCM10027511_39940 [Hymenobacter humi]
MPFTGYSQCSGRYEFTYPSGSSTTTTGTNNGSGSATGTYCPPALGSSVVEEITVYSQSNSNVTLTDNVGSAAVTKPISAGGTVTFAVAASDTPITYTLSSFINCPNNKPEIFTLTLAPTLTLEAAAASVCSGDGVLLTATGATPGSIYTFTAPGFSETSTTGSITVFPTATTTYTVSVPTSCGPNTQQQIEVFTPSLTTSSSPIGLICPGTPITLSAASNIAGTIFTFKDADGNILNNSSPTTAIVTPGSSTTYTVTTNNPSNCSNTGSANIPVTITPQVVTVSPTSLNTTRNTPFTLTATSNYPDATFQWTSNGPGGNAYPSGATVTTSVPGPQSSYNFTVTATAGACSTSKSVLVTLSNPLPVQLAAFSARRQGSVALLSWNTASEHNNAYFAVERSADGNSFAKLANVTGAGESSTPRAYTFTDQRPQAAITYYRLQQVDHNGQAAYSPVVALAAERAAGNWLVPTASPRQFTVQGTLDANSRFAVLDVLGRPVYTQALTPEHAAVTLPSLPTGVYVFSLTTEQGRFTVRQFVTGTN